MEIVFVIVVLVLIGWHVYDRKQFAKETAALLLAKQGDYDLIISYLHEVIDTLSKERQGDKENQAKLINAVVAKNSVELRDLGMVDKLRPLSSEPQPEVAPDVVPMDQLSEEEFDAHIQQTLTDSGV